MTNTTTECDTCSSKNMRRPHRHWKAPPDDPDKVWLGDSIEMQILLACSWNCHACNQLSNFHSISFIKKGTMTLSQVAVFVGEMQENDAYFGRIRILGGEPTMHPKFSDIVTTLYEDLVLKGHVGLLECVTNGDHLDRITPVAHMIQRVRVSREKAKKTRHIANLLHTPKSLGYKGQRCSTPEYCGWSLSYYGWGPCSPGASIMRLWGMMDEHQRMKLPMEIPNGTRRTEANWPKIQELCDLCQHGLRQEDMIKCSTGKTEEEQKLNSPEPEVWSKLGPWLAGKHSNYAAYGQPETE